MLQKRVIRMLLLAGLLGHLSAGAQNLVTNPDFDSGTTGWTNLTPSQGSLTWDSIFGSPVAGAALLNSPAPVTGSMFVGQRIPVTAGRRYAVRANRLYPPQAASGCVGLLVTYSSMYSPSACYGTVLETVGPLCNGPTSNWVATPRFSSVAPTGATCALVMLNLEKFSTSGSLVADFDHVFFGPPVKGDLDGFGETDLLFRQLDARTHYEAWLMNGVTRLATVPITPNSAGPEWNLVGTDDFNADGIQDLVFWNSATGQVQFWLMDDTGVNRSGAAVTLSGALPLATSWVISATGDFNHDGRADLLWSNTISHKLWIWIMNGTTKVGSLIPNPDQAADANWTVVGARDFNGDANIDLLWYNSTSGNIVFWFMDANMVRVSGELANPPSAGDNNWKVVATGDYGVGPQGQANTHDIVWRNDTSGKLVVWYMDNAGNRTDGTFTSPDAPTDPLNWNVVGPK